MNQIEELLAKKTTANYRKAAKLIAKDNLGEYASFLFSYLNEIIEDGKKWETSCEIINTLSIVQHRPLLQLIEPILERGKEHDMVTMVSARAFVRLTRKDSNDGKPVIMLYGKHCYAIAEGALESLGYDRMVPPEAEQAEIIKLFWNFGENRNANAYADPRYGLAAACAGWTVSICKDFLMHCLTTNDVSLKYVAEKSLQKKYVKLR